MTVGFILEGSLVSASIRTGQVTFLIYTELLAYHVIYISCFREFTECKIEAYISQ